MGILLCFLTVHSITCFDGRRGSGMCGDVKRPTSATAELALGSDRIMAKYA